MGHAVAVGFHLHQVAFSLKLFYRTLASFERVVARIWSRVLIERAVQVEDVDDGQLVALTYLEVEWVVPWGNLYSARAEFRVPAFVGHNRDRSVHYRQHSHLADVRLPARIVGMHGHRSIAKHRLRARGRHRDGFWILDFGFWICMFFFDYRVTY